MRLVTAIVQPTMMTQVQIALAHHGIAGMTVTECSGYARQRGHKEVYRGAEYTIDFISKAKIEVLVEDEEVEEVEEAPIMVTPFLRERPRPTTPAFRQPVSAMEMDDEDELPPLRGLEQQRQGGRERREPDFFDDIRIS